MLGTYQNTPATRNGGTYVWALEEFPNLIGPHTLKMGKLMVGITAYIYVQQDSVKMLNTD